jgi:hypothetical protein
VQFRSWRAWCLLPFQVIAHFPLHLVDFAEIERPREVMNDNDDREKIKFNVPTDKTANKKSDQQTHKESRRRNNEEQVPSNMLSMVSMP